jgi:hypothetical protein
VAREQLGYARTGDVVMMPTYPNQISESVDSPTMLQGTLATMPMPAQPNWQRWWQFLQSIP